MRTKAPSVAPDDFVGTDRFQVLRRIGAGGMGVVYEAFDREKNVNVALKTLKVRDGESILRLKQEFRALQDVQHPNLVQLGELIKEDRTWFFTMELVHGVDFLEYVRPRPIDSPDGRSAYDASTLDAINKDMPVLPPPSHDEPILDSSRFFDERRLRNGMAQLARGLYALHRAGKIHRDVKPSNIMVTHDERVVILDFGLATDVDPSGYEASDNVVGTVLYMAPEQSLGGRVGPEADWYSFGVLLYEALVGAPPFVGPSMMVLMQKQKATPKRPSALRSGVPADLDELCLELLRFDPGKRPSAHVILRLLGAGNLEEISTRSHSQLFVGREAELAMLDRAFADVRERRQVTVYLQGESGIGKSALVRAFTRRFSADESVVVLAGRCYEREAVPYKALDNIVDELASYVQRMTQPDAAAIMPQWADVLLKVFPVLSRIEVFADGPRHTILDETEQRTRLFAALRELLVRLCDRRKVIMWIDDLQWADADSLAMLSEVLRPPDSPSLLFLASWREAGEGDIRARLDALPGEIRHLPIGKLSETATAELVHSLIARSGVPLDRADEILREANGHPLFVDELVRFAATRGADVSLELSLEDALGNRLGRLDPKPRRVLELLSLAGAPLDQETVAHAANIAVGDFAQVAAQLRTQNFASTGGARKLDRIETYHDRVRDTVLQELDADRRKALHRDLSRALEASGRADNETLAVHFAGAGDTEKAASYAVDAAAAAGRAVAFDRAARLYQMAIDLAPAGPNIRALQIALGGALAKAGRGAEAGHALLAAAHGAPVAEALDLRGRAIQALLNAGQFDQGITELRDVLASQGVAYPKTSRRALMSVIGQRALIAMRGMRFKELDESQVAREVLSRIDVQYYAATTLAPIDNIRGASFQARTLRYALAAGERYRIARTLVTEAGYRALGGGRHLAAGDELLDLAQELSTRVDNPHLPALIAAGRGTAEFLKGNYAKALSVCQAAQAFARQSGVAEYAEFNLMYQWIAESLVWLGRLVETAAFTDQSIRDGEERGNLYLSTTMRTAAHPFVRLAADDPVLARDEIAHALDRWSPQRFHVQHFYALRAIASIDLYEGDPKAYERIQSEWKELVGSLLLRVSFGRTYMYDLRARAAILVNELDVAEADAKRVLKEQLAWSEPLAILIQAGIAKARSDRTAAIGLYEKAAKLFDTVDLALHAAAARRRLGELREDAAAIAAADAWMTGQKIQNPSRMTMMLAPVR
ncbi:MAG: protein kinase [Kofleriaceae bacterium]